jgi:uncharacterized protein (TIGR02246 family)
MDRLAYWFADRTMSIMQTTLDDPAGVSAAFVQAINAGDLESAIGLYREDAVLLAPDGSQARGTGAIRALLENLVTMRVQMTAQVKSIVVAEDFAVACEDWTMRLDTGRAQDNEQRGQSIVCFAHAEDGWRFLIDAPWGL